MNKDFKANLLSLKQWAFTLAETLIVMGIIGVVAALTLPNLNSSTGEKEKVAKVKKIYQNLQDAFGRAEAVYGPYDEWFKNDADKTTRFANRLTEFMKISKDCGTSTGCFKVGNTKRLNGSAGYADYGSASDAAKFITADGTAIAIEVNDAYSPPCVTMVVDIDGPNKGAFTEGIDIFYFELESQYTSLDNGQGIHPLNHYFNASASSCRTGGVSCASWIIKFDNMDYLKTDNTGKCTNNSSITLHETTNTTTCK